MNGISGFRPPVQFGIRIRLGENEAGAAGVSTLLTTIAPTATVGTASGSAGSYLQTAGTGLMSTGPQSSAAGHALGAMQTLGSEGAAAWAAANPSLGGTGMVVAGSILEGGSGASAKSTQSKAPN